MDRRTFIGAVAGGLFAGPSIADAQQSGKLPVVGVLFNNIAVSPSVRTFTQFLGELGYVDGTNIIIENRSAAGKPGAMRGLAAELVQRNVDVIFATGPAAIRAARDASSVTPIVALDLETDPVEAGWVKSLARPGGNLTGLFLNLPGLAGKWLELLKAAAPRIRRASVLWDSTTGSAQLNAVRAAAQAFALELRVTEVRSDEDVGAMLGGAGMGAGSDALVVLTSPALGNHQKEIADFTLKNRLPAISLYRRFAEGGGLLAYGPDVNEMRRRATAYVDKILKGARLGDLPVEQPTKFEFLINLKTAKALGLVIPQSLLLRADEVFQ